MFGRRSPSSVAHAAHALPSESKSLSMGQATATRNRGEYSRDRKVLCSPSPEQFERGRPSARRCAGEKIFTQFFTQLHQNWEFRGRKSESGRAVDSFIRKVLRSQSPSFSRSGEIGIRSRLKICRDLVPWGFKSPLRHKSNHLSSISYNPLFWCVCQELLCF